MQHRHQDFAKGVFTVTAGVRQPLTLAELREALSVRLGQKNLTVQDMVNESVMERVTMWCENLVHVEEADDSVHFCHHSIREFFLAPMKGHLAGFHVNLEDAKTHIAHLSLTYLNLENFMRTLDKIPAGRGDVQVSMVGIAGQTIQMAVKGSLGTRIGQWARHKAKTTAPLSVRQLAPGAVPEKTPFGSFWNYAAENWYLHDFGHDAAQARARYLIECILRDSHPRLRNPWAEHGWQFSPFLIDCHFSALDGDTKSQSSFTLNLLNKLWLDSIIKVAELRLEPRPARELQTLMLATAYAYRERLSIFCHFFISLISFLQAHGDTQTIEVLI